jgi:hypothetical protein
MELLESWKFPAWRISVALRPPFVNRGIGPLSKMNIWVYMGANICVFAWNAFYDWGAVTCSETDLVLGVTEQTASSCHSVIHA